MKVLTINGSHRRNGNTARVLSLFQRELEEAAARHGQGLEAETLFLSDRRIESCRGCRRCFDQGESACPHKDDVGLVLSQIMASDALVLASPVYVNDVSGTMKTLIDRLAFVCHRPRFARICGCMLATTGSSPVRHTIRSLQSAFLSWGGCLITAAGFTTGALMSPDEIGSRHAAGARKAAEALLRAVRTGRPSRPTFISLMMFRIQQRSWNRAAPDSVDYRYWQENGWFDRRCTFFLPHRANALKVLLARAVGIAVARAFAR